MNTQTRLYAKDLKRRTNNTINLALLTNNSNSKEVEELNRELVGFLFPNKNKLGGK